MTRNILHVITGLEVGGAEMALYRLILESLGSEYTHTVIALTPEGGMYARFLQAGIKLIVLDFRRAPFSNLVRLVRLMRSLRPDVVQTWLYHADLLGGLAARVAGVRNVIWGVRTTDVDGGCARATRWVRHLCAILSRLVPHTIVCVAEAARRSHSRIGYDATRMVVVGNGFDLSKLTASQTQRSELRAQCGLGPHDIVLGTLGRFNLDKDHANFVAAAGKLTARHARLRFLMVGKGLDPGNADLAGWIAATGHADRFVLLGERSDVAVCLSAMDIFCLSSRTEAFPNVVGEAMAMGLPCVATDVGDVGVLMGDTGVIVPKADPEALARGVTELVEHGPQYCEGMGRRARERIHAVFTMARVRERFEGIYEQVINGRKL
ncbi:glycosyltransferase [Massilia sp. IC2-477]|uniref:glycosyltransferase family 4 protein n=1 Tax=Massilia sp. IC2-477 TaxID=2887198 RepID=UPI001D10F7CF|nr:glycosyltransferase [Massilia sp. IC2-477]MCC2958537.1 glycosyltransferase [Massilia sp. IC2-477]